MSDDRDLMYDPPHSNDENCEDDEECCPCFPDKKIQMSLDNIILQSPAAGQKEYCRILKKDFKVYDDYVNKCDSKAIKPLLQSESDGIEKYIERGCNGHMAPEPTCNKADKALQAVKKCYDRFVNGAYYIMKNIPAKDQIAVYCCLREERSKLVADSYNKYCNKQYTKLMMDRYSGHAVVYAAKYCTPQRKKVCNDYPKEMKKLKEIITSSMTSGRSITYVWYRIHSNNILSDAYTYE